MDIDFRANPPFSYWSLLRKWFLIVGPLAPWWALVQYRQMMDELEEWRRSVYTPLIGAYWLEDTQATI